MIKFLFTARTFFFAQKYRFDLAVSFISVVNFTLLVAALGKNVFTPFSGSLFIVCILFLVWAFGWFMDKVVKAPQHTERESIQRSEVWKRHLEQMDEINRKLNLLLEKRS